MYIDLVTNLYDCMIAQFLTDDFFLLSASLRACVHSHSTFDDDFLFTTFPCLYIRIHILIYVYIHNYMYIYIYT